MAHNTPPITPAAPGSGLAPAPWNQGEARGIALDQTLVPDAALTDTLGGPKLQLISQEGRDLYIRRCTKEARKRGHSCSPSKLPAAAETTVEKVGDDLFKYAKP
jgi:hypothetical protein